MTRGLAEQTWNGIMTESDLDKRRLNNHIASLGDKWNAHAIFARVEIQFSRRLRSSLGRCSPGRFIVRLNNRLLESSALLLKEVLSHELAHIVTFERYGADCRPHGREWAALMRTAGFEPRIRAGLSRDSQIAHTTRAPHPVYEHRCPVCQMVRPARRPVPQWRCATCAAAGLEAKLLIAKRNGRLQ